MVDNDAETFLKPCELHPWPAGNNPNSGLNFEGPRALLLLRGRHSSEAQRAGTANKARLPVFSGRFQVEHTHHGVPSVLLLSAREGRVLGRHELALNPHLLC